MDCRDAARLAYVLTAITKVLEVELIERRIDELEKRMPATPDRPTERRLQ